jgi:drug/metabolite transporter (DMT)-like permease
MVVVLAGIAALLWGVGYSAVKIGYEWLAIAQDDVPSKLLFAGIRFLLAGLMAALCAWAADKKPPVPRRDGLKGIMLLSLFQTILQYSALYIALAHVTGAKSSILNQLGPFLLVLLAHMTDKKDTFHLGKAAGCAIGFSGIILINLGSGLNGGFSMLGEGFIVLSSLSAAVGYIVSKKATQHGGAILLSGYQQFIGGGVLAIAGLMAGGSLQIDSAKDIWILLYLSFSISAAYVIWALLLQFNDISKVSVYKFAVPVFGVISSGLLLGEQVWTIRMAASLVLVSLGIIAVNRRPGGKKMTERTGST